MAGSWSVLDVFDAMVAERLFPNAPLKIVSIEVGIKGEQGLRLAAHVRCGAAGELAHPVGDHILDRDDAKAGRQALIERGGCLYTYPAPDYFALPKRLRSYASKVVAVIHPDMILHVHERSSGGVEGPEIVAGGFPITPVTFCGRRG